MTSQPSTYGIPYVLHETSRGIEAVSIFDEMLSNRELSLVGEVSNPLVHTICQHVRRLDAVDPTAPLTLYVESPGGEVSVGLELYDTLRATRCPVRTVCASRAASMGAVIFMAGDERVMYPHAELMIHDPLIDRGAGGSALSVQETSRRLMATRRTLNTILAERSGLTLARVQRLTGKDTFLGADRALELGFATTVLANEKEN